MRKDKFGEFISRSLEETFAWGVAFGKSLTTGTTLALKGDLGSGKTSLMKGIAHGIIGIDPREVTSPTFTYLHIYHGKLHSLYHFDFYRLKKTEDFLALGFQDYFTTDHFCCIEWPECISTLLPPNTIELVLSHLEEGTRRICF